MKTMRMNLLAVFMLSIMTAASTVTLAQTPDTSGGSSKLRRIGGDHFRDAIDRLIKSDYCRLDLEAEIADSDAARLQTNLITVRDDQHDIDSLEPLIREAKKSEDTALYHSLLVEAWDLEASVREALVDVRVILWRYPGELEETLRECHGDKDTSKFVLEVKPLFPNPVTLLSGAVPATTLDYSISEPASVTITVSDVEGTAIETVLDAEESEGSHSVVISVAGWKIGTYYVRVTAGGQTRTDKLAIVE